MRHWFTRLLRRFRKRAPLSLRALRRLAYTNPAEKSVKVSGDAWTRHTIAREAVVRNSPAKVNLRPSAPNPYHPTKAAQPFHGSWGAPRQEGDRLSS